MLKMVFVALIILVAGCDIPQSSRPRSERDAEPDRTDLIYYGRHAVRRALKAPDSAEFPVVGSGDYTLTELPSGRYNVTGVVKAKNSFGVMLEQAWEVEYRRVGDQIKPLYIALGGDVIYGSK